MTICRDCQVNVEWVRMPNGGTVCMNAVPGLFIEDEQGPDVGVEPRRLTQFRGHRLTLNAAQEAQAAGQRVVRAWVRHLCPTRAKDAPAGSQSRSTAIAETQVVTPEQPVEHQPDLF